MTQKTKEETGFVSDKSSLPLLSIVVPTRNGEEFIAQALDSVVSQNYPHLEVIIVDGLSTDSTLNIAKQYALKYPFITIVSESDSGQSDALNKGIKLARGEILGLLNDDDFYQRGIFQEVINEFKNVDFPSLIIGNCQVYNKDLEPIKYQAPKHLGLEYFIYGRQLHPANPTQYFYHRKIHDIIGPYPESDHLAMDLWFYLECCSNRQINLKYVDKHWGNFRVYPGTKTSDNQHLHKTIRRSFQRRYIAKTQFIPLVKALTLGFYELHKTALKKLVRAVKKASK